MSPAQDDRDEPVRGETEVANSLPPVVPEDDDAEVANSLPPVVPEDDETQVANSLPPVVPEDDDAEVANSLPPVVPEDDDAEVANSLPPVVPEDDETEVANSLPPVVPEDADVSDALAPVVPQDDEHGPDTSRPADDAEPARPDDDPTDEPQPASPADPAVETTLPAETSGWVVLRQALRPRPTRAQLVAGVLCALLGFALVAQVRQSGEADLGGMRQGDLVRILDETTNRGDALARESADLARERDDLVSGSDRRQAALDALRRSAETQGILTGRLPAEGPGVVVTLTEPDGVIKPITMLNMLEELRNAGAEAVQLNDQRVTASSAFTGTGGAVVLDGVTLTAPYRWIAIGDPDIIAPALQIPGGAMAQVRNNGGKGTVDRVDLAEVTAIRVVPDPVYATPVPPEGD